MLLQEDGAPCYKAKVRTKWFVKQNIQIVGLSLGNSLNINLFENL